MGNALCVLEPSRDQRNPIFVPRFQSSNSTKKRAPSESNISFLNSSITDMDSMADLGVSSFALLMFICVFLLCVLSVETCKGRRRGGNVAWFMPEEKGKREVEEDDDDSSELHDLVAHLGEEGTRERSKVQTLVSLMRKRKTRRRKKVSGGGGSSSGSGSSSPLGKDKLIFIEWSHPVHWEFDQARTNPHVPRAQQVLKVQLAQYVPALERLATMRLLQQVSNVYQSMKIETLSGMIPFFDFSQVEKSLESDGLRDHLANFAEELNKARQMIYPPDKRSSKLGALLPSLSEVVAKEHKRLLA
ncbi:Eukaryotic translation initiation factor 3 subunit A [Glycine soja]